MDFFDPHTQGFLHHDLEVGKRHQLIFYTDRQIQLLHRQANPAFSESQDLVSDAITVLGNSCSAIHGFVRLKSG